MYSSNKHLFLSFFPFSLFLFEYQLAQSTTGPIIPANTCGTYSYMCQETAELHPLGATVVTVGVNVGGYSGAALDVHFKDVASRDDLYLKIEDINGPGLDDMITELLVSVFGRCGVTCGTGGFVEYNLLLVVLLSLFVFVDRRCFFVLSFLKRVAHFS